MFSLLMSLASRRGQASPEVQIAKAFSMRLVVITFPGFDADIRQLPVCALG